MAQIRADPVIQKPTFIRARSATFAESPITSAVWAIALNRRVPGQIPILAADDIARMTPSRVPDNIFRPMVGARRDWPQADSVTQAALYLQFHQTNVVWAMSAG